MTRSERSVVSRRDLVRVGLGLIGLGVVSPLVAACGGASPTQAPATGGTAPPTASTATTAAAKPTAAAGQPTAAAQAPSPTPAAQAAPKPSDGPPLQFFSVEAPAAQEVLLEHLETFGQQTGIKVEYTFVPGGNVEFNQKLQTMIAGGVPPDLHYVDFRNFARYAFEGHLLHLDPFVQRDNYDIDDMHPKFLSQCYWDGKLYAFGRAFGWQQIFYNVDLFKAAGVALPPDDWKAPGWTFDDFAAAAEQLTKRDASGRVEVWGFANATTINPFMYANGGRFVDENNEKATVYEEPTLRAIEFLADLMHNRKASQTPEAARELGGTQAFMGGRAAMVLGATISTVSFLDIKDFEWDTTIIPRGWDLEGDRRNHGGGGGWAASSHAKNQDAAWQALAFVCDKEVQAALARVGTPPYRRSILYSEDWLDPSKPPKSKKVMSDGADYIVANPKILTWNEFEPEINRILEPVWLGKQTVRDVVPALKQKADELVARHLAEVNKR